MLLVVVSKRDRRGFFAVSGGEVSCCTGEGVRCISAAGASADFWEDGGGVIDDGGGVGVLLLLLRKEILLDCVEVIREFRFCDIFNASEEKAD